MVNDKKTLILIDASALIYRAYYALPPLTTPDGTLVNAVYGFTSAIFNAIKNFHPEYIAVAFDSKAKTFRHKEYKEYKANRPAAPKELIAQIPLARQVCHMLNMPYFEAPGYEADDLIGTIAEKITIYNLPVSHSASSPRFDEAGRGGQLTTVIVTGDMDTLQLINENTQVYSMARGINKAVVYNGEKVQEKYGFEPKFIIDYKALRGDPSDNIPGVPGIGEKTATELIKAFGAIESLYKQIPNSLSARSLWAGGQIPKPKTIDLLLKYKKQAFLSKKLATILLNVPIDFVLKSCEIHDYNRNKAVEFFRVLGFKSLIPRLPQEKSAHKQESLF